MHHQSIESTSGSSTGSSKYLSISGIVDVLVRYEVPNTAECRVPRLESCVEVEDATVIMKRNNNKIFLIY